jgi:hypothetical protein
MGRPRKDQTVEREVKREPIKMKARPNWEHIDPMAEDSPDKLHIDPNLIPPGMAALWVTDSVYGQPMPQHRAGFEKKGWTPVHQEDFDGQFDGMFMPRGMEGEIKMDGLTLMMRPMEMNIAAKKRERRAAMEQVAVKEQALRGGDLPVSLDSQHSTALQSNRINKSFERISIPED